MQKQTGNACVTAEDQTVVHCRYMSKYEYGDGGWVSISPTTYLVNAETSERLLMTAAINIPLSPVCRYFDRPGEFIDFTLVFPELPPHWKRFHLIEEEQGANFQVRMVARNQEGVYQVQVV